MLSLALAAFKAAVAPPVAAAGAVKPKGGTLLMTSMAKALGKGALGDLNKLAKEIESAPDAATKLSLVMDQVTANHNNSAAADDEVHIVTCPQCQHVWEAQLKEVHKE